MPWQEFVVWWRETWQPGEHVYISALTGAGKTTLGVRLVEHRPFVAAMDAKGMDRSLSATGWPRVTTWLPRSVREDIRDRRPVRIVLGGRNNSDADFAKLQALLIKSIKGVWAMGKWVAFCDEGQILADVRYIGGGPQIEKMLIAARDRGVSVVFGTQRPSVGQNAPTAIAAQQQSSWLFISRTRDTGVHQRLAELAGRPTAEMAQLIPRLPKYCWAALGIDPWEPIRLTIPPPLPRRGARQPRSELSYRLWGYSVAV
jgi:hypothetical protein